MSFRSAIAPDVASNTSPETTMSTTPPTFLVHGGLTVIDPESSTAGLSQAHKESLEKLAALVWNAELDMKLTTSSDSPELCAAWNAANTYLREHGLHPTYP